MEPILSRTQNTHSSDQLTPKTRISSAKERSIQVQISISHAVYREARGSRRPAGGSIDFTDTINRIYGCIDSVDQEAGHTRVDQFGHGSAIEGDHRRAAGERLHD